MSLKMPNIANFSLNKTLYMKTTRFFSLTSLRGGLGEFFDNDPTQNKRQGLAWTKELLQNKSNVDIHKLWYVILKEMNLQRTRMEEFERESLNEIQTHESIRKLQLSLNRIKEIIDERTLEIANNVYKSDTYLQSLEEDSNCESLENEPANTQLQYTLSHPHQKKPNYSKESLDYVERMRGNVTRAREMNEEAEKLREEEFEYKEKKLSGEFQRSFNRYRFPHYLPSKPAYRQYVPLDVKLGK